MLRAGVLHGVYDGQKTTLPCPGMALAKINLIGTSCTQNRNQRDEEDGSMVKVNPEN